MPDYQYFCHACKKTISKVLTLAEYEEGEVLCPPYEPLGPAHSFLRADAEPLTPARRRRSSFLCFPPRFCCARGTESGWHWQERMQVCSNAFRRKERRRGPSTGRRSGRRLWNCLGRSVFPEDP